MTDEEIKHILNSKLPFETVWNTAIEQAIGCIRQDLLDITSDLTYPQATRLQAALKTLLYP